MLPPSLGKIRGLVEHGKAALMELAAGSDSSSSSSSLPSSAAISIPGTEASQSGEGAAAAAVEEAATTGSNIVSSDNASDLYGKRGEFYYSQNPLCTPPPDVLHKGNAELLEYLAGLLPGKKKTKNSIILLLLFLITIL